MTCGESCFCDVVRPKVSYCVLQDSQSAKVLVQLRIAIFPCLCCTLTKNKNEYVLPHATESG